MVGFTCDSVASAHAFLASWKEENTSVKSLGQTFFHIVFDLTFIYS